jgi:chromosome segregation ATPase
MVFSLGNLLVLGIVLVILAIYRQIDKSNRSLEKVRKYADKAREELDGVVVEKVRNLKDLAIELEVHQKAAKEILKRTQGIEDGIQEKFSAADSIAARIKEYDRVLDELVQMTRRAEENIGRIKEESEFTDTVAKKIRVVSTKLDEQEARIPDLVKVFQEKNGEVLKIAEEKVLHRAEERIGEMEGRLSLAAAKADELNLFMRTTESETREHGERIKQNIAGLGEELVTKVTSDLSKIEEEYGQRLDDAARRGESLETKALVKLKEHIEEKLKVLSRELTAQIEAGKSDIESKMDGLGAVVDRARSDATEEMEGIKAENTAAIGTYRAVLRDKLDDLEGTLYQAEKAMEEKIAAVQEKGFQQTDSMVTRINQDIEAKTQSLQADMDHRLAQLYQTAAASGEKIEEMYNSLRARAEDWSGKLEKALTEISGRVKIFDDHVHSALGEGKVLVEAHLSETRERLSSFEEDTLRKVADLRTSLEAAETEVRSRAEEVSGRADGLIGETLEDLRLRINGVREEGDKLGAAAIERCKALVAGNEEQIRLRIEKISGEIARAEDLNTEASERISRIKETMDGNSKSIETALQRFMADFEARITKTGEALETRVIGDLDTRLQDYEKNINYRFSRIEEVSQEVDNLENTLRVTMDRITARLREDFSNFGKDLHEKRLSDKALMEKAMEDLKDAMGELERGLAELKTRAYDNVSEKLKIFEDEFFHDLHSRDQAMQSKFSEWQSKLDSSLDNLARDEQEERTRLEQQYSEDLKGRLGEFQGRVNLQIDKFEGQVGEFQRTISGRMGDSEKILSSFQENIRQDIEEAKSNSKASIREEFTRHDAEIGGELEGFQKNFDLRLKGLRDTFENREKELSDLLENVRSDVTLWQAKVLQDLKSSEAEVNNQFAGFKVQVSGTISGLRDDFTAQKNDLVNSTNEERLRLKDELKTLGEGVATLEEDLKKRTEEALEAFRNEYGEFQGEYIRRNKDLQTEADQKIRDFRNIIQDTREQFDTLHQKLFGKIEESSKLLSVNLSEIDKRQKNFIEQTKIFERADSLKISLQENIEELKGELSKVDAHRKEVKEMESQFVKLKKLGDEVTEKMSRFIAEKRRIDNIEEDYKRLMGLSESVEQKIRQVSSTDDSIQTIQASLRSLESLQLEVDSRFERLEKKRKILDLTTEGVDKNFQTLGEMEKRILSIEDELGALPDRMDALSERIRTLSSGKDQADDAVKQLSSIDGLLKDLEGRMDSLQKAREWLARTETRIEEVSRDAQEQVKLLGSLLKEGAKTGVKKERGAPSMSARETVTKLAHQGWTVEQIAMATKLSRGEVELILELIGK